MNLSLYIEDRDDLLSLYDQLEKNKIEYYCKSSQIKNIDFTSPDVIVTGANILITTITDLNTMTASWNYNSLILGSY